MLFLAMITQNCTAEDKSKFEQLYYKYRNTLFFAALNIVKNRTDAEDVLQNVFIKIAKNMNSVGDLESRKTLSYLLVITKNSAYDYMRKNFKSEEIPLESIEEQADFDFSIEKMISSLEYRKTVKAITRVPSPYNEVLYLHYVMDYSVKKTAVILDRKESTVKMQIVRGKKILLEKLSEVQYE